MPRSTVLANDVVKKRINTTYGGIVLALDDLKKAISLGKWSLIGPNIENLMNILLDQLDVGADPAGRADKDPKKKMNKELFVMLGGMDCLLQLLSEPFIKTNDAREIKPRELRSFKETLNEVLFLMKELISAQPNLAERLIKLLAEDIATRRSSVTSGVCW